MYSSVAKDLWWLMWDIFHLNIEWLFLTSSFLCRPFKRTLCTNGLTRNLDAETESHPVTGRLTRIANFENSQDNGLPPFCKSVSPMNHPISMIYVCIQNANFDSDSDHLTQNQNFLNPCGIWTPSSKSLLLHLSAIVQSTQDFERWNRKAFNALARPRQQFILLLWICICMVKKKIANKWNNQY